MAKLLDNIFYEAQKFGGRKAVMRLVVKTNTTSKRAKEMPDNPETVRAFRLALADILNTL